MNRRLIQQLASKLTWYGLDESFRGTRWIATYGENPDRIELGHARPPADQRLYVGVMDKAIRDAMFGVVDIQDTLATILSSARGRITNGESFTSSDWREVSIDVDHKAREFQRVEAAPDWVAHSDEGEYWLYIHVFGGFADPISIVRVAWEDYFDEPPPSLDG